MSWFKKDTGHSVKKPVRIRIDYDARVLGYRELAQAIERALRAEGYGSVNVVRDRDWREINHQSLADPQLSTSRRYVPFVSASTATRSPPTSLQDHSLTR